MKKPNPIPLIDQMAFNEWQEKKALDDLSDDDKAGNDAVEQFKAAAKKGRANGIAEIIRGLGLTKRQIEIFESYVETNNYSETARLLNIRHPHVMRTVEKIQQRVKIALSRVQGVHK